MAFSDIPFDDIFDLHEEGVDALLDALGVTCVVSYPPIKIPCDCNPNPIGQKPASFTFSGAPAPVYSTGCQNCNGTGIRESVATDSLTIQIFWEPKQFIDLGLKIKLPDGIIQCKGYLTDLSKLRRAASVLVNSPQQNYINAKFRLWGEPITHGFRNNRYFIAYLERI